MRATYAPLIADRQHLGTAPAERNASEISRQIERRWSFPEYLAQRERLLSDAWHELEAKRLSVADYARGRPACAEEYSGRDLPGADRWIIIPAPRGPVHYPVVLDVAELIAPYVPLSDGFWEILAPRWQTLQALGLTRPSLSKPRWDDIQGGENGAMLDFALGVVAGAVAALGPMWGIRFAGDEYFDEASRRFLRRLRSEASISGLQVVSAETRHGDQREDVGLIDDAGSEGALALAEACPQGVPVTAVERAGAGPLPRDTLDSVAIGGVNYLYVRSALDDRRIPDYAATASTLFDSWPPDGWGYLRRGRHAVLAKGHRLRANHTTFVLGMSYLGPKHSYLQCEALTRELGSGRRIDQTWAAILAGRLADGLRERAAARELFAEALRLAPDVETRIEIIYELANLEAKSKESKGLRRARVLYHQGTALLSTLGSTRSRLFLTVRMLNGEALVDHREGRKSTALGRERRALALVKEAQSAWPAFVEWAAPLIRGNIAVLLRGLDRLDAAVRLLRRNLDSAEPVVDRNARLDLAQMALEDRDFEQVIELLRPLHALTAPPRGFNEYQELYGLSMLLTSLITVDRPSEAGHHLQRFGYLSRIIDVPAATRAWAEALISR